MGRFAPHCIGNGVEVKRALIRAAIQGINEIWEAIPGARLVNLTPLCHVAPPREHPEMQPDADWFNEKAVLESWDMLAGKVMPELGGSRRHLDAWWRAITEALDLPDDELPEITRPMEGPPPAHRWAERDRPAADRLVAAKAAVAALADEHHVPAENLVQPDAVRRLAWRPPEPSTPGAVGDALHELGVREWQIGLVAGPLAKALGRLAAHEIGAHRAGESG